jgi:hypothetical protein
MQMCGDLRVFIFFWQGAFFCVTTFVAGTRWDRRAIYFASVGACFLGELKSERVFWNECCGRKA